MKPISSNKPIIIAFSGRFHSGKDTAADYVGNNPHYKFERLAFANPLKHGVAAFFGFSNEQVFGPQKDEVDEFWGVTPGKLLQLFGSDICRVELARLLPQQFGESDIWIRRMKRDIHPNTNYLITDARFPDEAEFVKSIGGHVVRIVRAQELRIASAKASGVPMRDPNHISETALDGYWGWSHVVTNNGTLDEFYTQLDGVMEEIALGSTK